VGKECVTIVFKRYVVAYGATLGGGDDVESRATGQSGVDIFSSKLLLSGSVIGDARF
jgi:hypothetical protein